MRSVSMLNASLTNRVMRSACQSVCLAAVLVCLGFPDSQAGEIHGAAYEKNGTTPVAGVAIQLFHDSAKVDETNTGSDGRYKVLFNEPGKYKITFTKLPDQCVAPYADEDIKNASDAKQEDVYVYPKDEKIGYQSLLEAVRKRAAVSGDTAKYADDIVALSKTGTDPDTLVKVSERLIAAGYKVGAIPITGKLTDFDGNLLILNTTQSPEPKKLLTSYQTAFIDASGKTIPLSAAKGALLGKAVTVFNTRDGVPGSVVEQSLMGNKQ